MIRRWHFLLAGLAATIVTLVRTIGGGRGDLPKIVDRLGGADITAVVYINWYALSAAFAVLAIALFAAIRLPDTSARAIGMIAAFVFGATGLLFMIFSARATGSPFAYFPWLPLSVTAALSAFAAWRA